MTIDQLIEKINIKPDSIEFDEVINAIKEAYHFTPTRFSNGIENDVTVNEIGTNEGSCKVFAFARLNKLNEEQTLACFGRYYREDVIGHPDSKDHANIRHFMKHGWDGISFEGEALLSVDM